MAIFSYTTGSDSQRISFYANEIISNYSSVLLSDLTFIGDPEFKISSYSEELEEQRAYSYDDSAVVGLDSTDYGFINEVHTLDDDFGDVTDSTNYAYQRIDYGFLTPDTTIKPFGSIGNITEFADVALVRNSVGGVTFAMFGAAKIFVLPIHIGRGSFLARGDAAIAFSAQFVGSGKLFEFSSSAVTKASKQDGAGLFKLTSTSTNSFSPASHVGSGSLFGLSSSTYAESNAEKTGVTTLFRFSGGITNEISVSSYAGRGSLFSFISHTESVAYSYNESSVVSVDFDDYGLISESPVVEDDYLTIGDTALNYPWQFANYGYITDNETRLPFGRFQIKSDSGIVNSPSPVCSGTIKVSGDAKVYVLPIHIGSGAFRLYTATIPAFSPKVIGKGSLFGFGGGAEATAPQIATTTALFRVTGRAAEATVPATHVGSGSFFTFISKTEVYGANPPESIALFKISGAATNEQRAYGYNGTGSLFAISGHVEKVSYAYNESSVVAPDCLDYGFISAVPDDVPDPEVDCGLISDLDIRLPWQKSDYGYITDFETRLPYGRFEISNEAQTPFSAVVIGSGSIRNITGEASVYVTPIHLGSGSVFVSGAVETKFQIRTFGSGRMFGFGSSAEVIGSNPPDSTLLFTITGAATNIQASFAHEGSGTINLGKSSPGLTGDGSRAITIFRLKHFGSGSLFAFTGSAESTTNRPVRGIELFRFVGTTAYQRNFNYNVLESSFGTINITGAATNVEFSRYQIGSGEFKVTGSATPIFRLKHIGSGRFSTFTGSAEVFGANPQENTELFKIHGSSASSETIRVPATTVEARLFGTAVEKNTEAYSGSGSLFGIGGSSQIFKVSADASGLFKLTGAAAESVIPAPHVGSGSLFTFISKTEVYGANPPESTALFKITGTATERNTEAYVGTGSLFTFTSATESSGANPPVSGLFRIAGSAVEKNTEAYVGTGSLFTFVSKTESVSNAESTKGLFRITGSVRVYRTFPNYDGSGRIFGFSGSAESSGANPPVSALFKIAGSSQERISDAHEGTGSLFTFVSKTEAVAANPPEQTALFRINGSADVSRVFPTYVGSGSLFTFVSKTESFAVAPRAASIFTFSGSAVEKNTEAYRGTGTFSTISGASLSFLYTYELTKVLFQFSSGAAESFTPTNYNGSVLLDINGNVTNSRYVVYAPPRQTRIYVI